MKVTLRQRTKGKKISLYLDIYVRGRRVNEYLKLYLTPDPEEGKLDKKKKDENKQALLIAEQIRSKRYVELVNGTYGLNEGGKLDASFTKYFESLAKQRRRVNESNYGNWKSALVHIKKFAGEEVLFRQVHRQWLEEFKDYLMFEAKSKTGKKLSRNTQSSYFGKVRAALNEALVEGLIKSNPFDQVKAIPAEETERQFLTLSELNAIANIDCESPVLKQAFIFSCLTGIRWIDIENLIWKEIQYSEENGWFIRFRQQKTKGCETLYISEQARELLGKALSSDELVFTGLSYSSMVTVRLQRWMTNAGIYKAITFHCARHTFATLQLTLGTDIYTLSKLLGHRKIQTTQGYAHLIDEKKVEAVNRIKLAIQ